MDSEVWTVRNTIKREKGQKKRCWWKLEKENKIINSDRVYRSFDHQGLSHWVQSSEGGGR